MTMKAILVPLEDSGAAPAMLATAWLAAQRFSGMIEALYVRRSLPGVVVADIGGYAAATPDLIPRNPFGCLRSGQTATFRLL